jgi:hypothetical protein
MLCMLFFIIVISFLVGFLMGMITNSYINSKSEN